MAWAGFVARVRFLDPLTAVAKGFRYNWIFDNDGFVVKGEGGWVSGSTMAGLNAEMVDAGSETGVAPSSIGQLSAVPVEEAGGDDDACRLLGFAAVFLRGPL